MLIIFQIRKTWGADADADPTLFNEVTETDRQTSDVMCKCKKKHNIDSNGCATQRNATHQINKYLCIEVEAIDSAPVIEVVCRIMLTTSCYFQPVTVCTL